MEVSLAKLKILERFLSHVSIPKDDSCWCWTARRQVVGGYGQFSIGGKPILAHRMSYELFVGMIPDGMFVCHHCDVPWCVRPSHLFVADHAENMVDMMQKGRSCCGDKNTARLRPWLCPRGETHGMAKVTADDVVEMRKMIRRGLSLRGIGEVFGLTKSQVFRIVHRKAWKHVKE